MDLPMMEYAFFQGRIVPFADAKISIGTHTVQYGTGAFAGIRGYLDDDGGGINIFRLPDHAERLLNSSRLLRAELPFDRDSLATTIVSLVERNAPKGDVYIRPFVYKPAVQLTPRLRGLGDELAVYMLPMGDYLKLDRGQRAIVSSWFRIPDNAIPSRGKLIGAYVNSAFAKDEAEEKGADEAIMLNTAGKVAEGSGCNLFIARNDTLITPSITGDILEGITRRSMLRMASDAGIRTEEREDRPDGAVRRGRGVLLRNRRPGRLDRSHRRAPRGQGTDGPDHHPPPDHVLRYRARPIDPLRRLDHPRPRSRRVTGNGARSPLVTFPAPSGGHSRRLAAGRASDSAESWRLRSARGRGHLRPDELETLAVGSYAEVETSRGRNSRQPQIHHHLFMVGGEVDHSGRGKRLRLTCTARAGSCRHREARRERTIRTVTTASAPMSAAATTMCSTRPMSRSRLSPKP